MENAKRRLRFANSFSASLAKNYLPFLVVSTGDVVKEISVLLFPCSSLVWT